MKECLEKRYGDCPELLEITVKNLEANEGVDLPEPIFKSRLLTNGEVDKWDAYNALGTVEEIRSAMKYLRLAKKNGTVGQVIEKCAEYESLGTLEELREAREKQVPKKPITYPNTNRADCPVCGATVRGINKPFGNFCSKCGRAIDWE